MSEAPDKKKRPLQETSLGEIEKFIYRTNCESVWDIE